MQTRIPKLKPNIFLSAAFLATGILLGCQFISRFISAPTPTPIPTPNYSFDPSANFVLFFGDFRNYAEPPRDHEVCQYDSIPLLRIWGDGLTFLDLGYTPDGPDRWQGQLAHNQLLDLIQYLEENAFFDGPVIFATQWGPPTPYVPKIWYQLGVHLKSNSVLHESPTVDLFWPEFTAHVRSFLSPLEISDRTDSRIRNLNIGTRVCTTPIPE